MKKQEQYNVGIYCRLSKDDIGAGDSSSIISQKCMLEKYVHDNGWAAYDCYIDDGFSGYPQRIFIRAECRKLLCTSVFEIICSDKSINIILQL
jgi:DNA invertase Pin-like site-specific DNA recombinase